MATKPKIPTDADGVVIPFITAYGPKLRVGFACDPETDRTQQSFAQDADINVIMARYLRTGVLPRGSEAPPQYVDMTAIDFQRASDAVAAASGAFSLLSSEERDAYGNRVEVWLDAMAEQRAAEAAEADAAARAGGGEAPPASERPEGAQTKPQASPQASTPPAQPGGQGGVAH